MATLTPLDRYLIEKLTSLTAKSYSLHGRKITGGSKSVLPKDYVTRQEFGDTTGTLLAHQYFSINGFGPQWTDEWFQQLVDWLGAPLYAYSDLQDWLDSTNLWADIGGGDTENTNAGAIIIAQNLEINDTVEAMDWIGTHDYFFHDDGFGIYSASNAGIGIHPDIIFFAENATVAFEIARFSKDATPPTDTANFIGTRFSLLARDYILPADFNFPIFIERSTGNLTLRDS